MRRIAITLEGITPLLCNRFTDEAAQSASSGSTNSTTGDKGSPQEQCQKKLYIGHDGKAMIPQPNLLRCIMDGGTFFKIGKKQVTTQKSSLVPACVTIEEIEIPIQHKDPWTVDTRAVRIPSTGGGILTHRPCFNDWRLSFEIVLDETLIGPKLLREIVDAAGKRIGLGDFRPSCKGPFGRFVVVEWRILEDAA